MVIIVKESQSCIGGNMIIKNYTCWQLYRNDLKANHKYCIISLLTHYYHDITEQECKVQPKKCD